MDFDDWRELMEDSPVAHNHGSSTPRMVDLFGSEGTELWDSLAGRKQMGRPRKSLADADVEFRSSKDGTQGLAMIPTREQNYHGMVAHRGLLTEAEAEWVDWDEVEQMAMEHLGTSVAEIERIFSAGTPSPADRATKAQIEDRLLATQENGGNMTALAAVLGWTIQPDGKCRTMQKALRRARERRASEEGL